MNENKLRGKIAENRMSIAELCRQAGLKRSTFDRKLSGVLEFTRPEITKLIIVLGLDWSEVKEIFFDDIVTQTRNKGGLTNESHALSEG